MVASSQAPVDVFPYGPPVKFKHSQRKNIIEQTIERFLTLPALRPILLPGKNH